MDKERKLLRHEIRLSRLDFLFFLETKQFSFSHLITQLSPVYNFNTPSSV